MEWGSFLLGCVIGGLLLFIAGFVFGSVCGKMHMVHEGGVAIEMVSALERTLENLKSKQGFNIHANLFVSRNDEDDDDGDDDYCCPPQPTDDCSNNQPSSEFDWSLN